MVNLVVKKLTCGLMCIIRFFGGDTSLVPTQALTVGVGTVMDVREVGILTNMMCADVITSKH